MGDKHPYSSFGNMGRFSGVTGYGLLGHVALLYSVLQCFYYPPPIHS